MENLRADYAKKVKATMEAWKKKHDECLQQAKIDEPYFAEVEEKKEEEVIIVDEPKEENEKSDESEKNIFDMLEEQMDDIEDSQANVVIVPPNPSSLARQLHIDMNGWEAHNLLLQQ